MVVWIEKPIFGVFSANTLIKGNKNFTDLIIIIKENTSILLSLMFVTLGWSTWTTNLIIDAQKMYKTKCYSPIQKCIEHFHEFGIHHDQLGSSSWVGLGPPPCSCSQAQAGKGSPSLIPKLKTASGWKAVCLIPSTLTFSTHYILKKSFRK